MSTIAVNPQTIDGNKISRTIKATYSFSSTVNFIKCTGSFCSTGALNIQEYEIQTLV